MKDDCGKFKQYGSDKGMDFINQNQSLVFKFIEYFGEKSC
jgi:hypothetical protein